jgi:hypothetical protein
MSREDKSTVKENPVVRSRVFKSGVICLTMFLTLAGAVMAQEPAQISSHERAAREFFRLMGGAKMAEEGAEAMMGVIRENPGLAPYEDVFREWIKKVFASGDLEGEMAAIYMGAYSEAELREIIAFYKTPVGQKTLATLPELMKQGAELGMKRAQAHSAELEAMLEKAKEEREKQKEPEK